MGASISDWFAQHPIQGVVVGAVFSVLSMVLILVVIDFVRRKREPDRHGVPTLQAVRDMIRKHQHADHAVLEADLRALEDRYRHQTELATQLMSSHQRAIESLQRSVVALQRKVQAAEGKPARKPRGKKAQEPKDVWDHLLEDAIDGQAPREG